MSDPSVPSLDRVLSRIALRGTDPGAVTDYAMGMIAARSRRRRVAGGTAAVLVLAVGTTAVAAGTNGSDSQEVVSPADAPTTTERSARSTTTAAPVAPSTTSALITAPTVATTTTGLLPPPTLPPPPPPPTPAPTAPPTIAVDQPGSGTLEVQSGVAGALLDLKFQFNDPDGPAVAPAMSIRTDEPGTAQPKLETRGADPCSGGPDTTGNLHEPVQFASTGQRNVWVTVQYCDAPPLVFSSPVQVGDPTFVGASGSAVPGRAVMAGIPNLPNLLEGARWEFVTDDGQTFEVKPANSKYTHPLESAGGSSRRGVVIVLPAGSGGRLLLTTQRPTPGTYAGAVAPGQSSASAPRIPMQIQN